MALEWTPEISLDLSDVSLEEWSGALAAPEDGSSQIVYVDPAGRLETGAAAILDVDLYELPGTTGWALGPDGTHALAKRLIGSSARAGVDALVAHPEFTGSRWPLFAEMHGIVVSAADGESELDLSRAIFQLFARRVGDRLYASAREVAEVVVAHPDFDPLDEGDHSDRVESLVGNDNGRLVTSALDEIYPLTHENGMMAAAEGEVASIVEVYFVHLMPAEQDRLEFMSGDERIAAVAAACPELSAARASAAFHPLRDLLDESSDERRLRFATVVRALLASGQSKAEVAALLGIKQVKLTNTINDVPENIALAPDDYLRAFIAGIADLPDGMPTAAEVLTARQRRRVDAQRAIESAADQIPMWAKRVLNELDRRSADQFALGAHRDREQVVSRLLPDLHPAVVERVAGSASHDLWQDYPEERLQRYATAIRALQGHGATRAEAGRHLGIAASRVTSTLRRAPEDVELAPNDYLCDLIQTYT